MITAAVLAPYPPLLLRELSGREDLAAGLRAACTEVLAAATADGPDRVVVVGPAERTGAFAAAPAPVRRFGTTGPRPRPPVLPLSLGVGTRLLAEAGWTGPTELRGVTADVPAEQLDALAAELAARPGRTVLLALGEGSARRAETAPGYLDERAFDFDAGIVGALEQGDAAALRGLDASLAEELMVLGRPALQLLGAVGSGAPRPRARVAYSDDPYGVLYLVALWELAGS